MEWGYWTRIRLGEWAFRLIHPSRLHRAELAVGCRLRRLTTDGILFGDLGVERHDIDHLEATFTHREPNLDGVLRLVI
jgi:hypothetical protein